MDPYSIDDDYIDKMKDFIDAARRRVFEARQRAILTREFTITARGLAQRIVEGQSLKFPPVDAKSLQSI